MPTPTPGPAVISLNGAHASGDIDLANGNAHIVGALPGLPDFSGELLVVGSSAWYRTPGQNVFTETDVSTLTYNPADKTSGPVALVNTILSVAADKSLKPKLLGTGPDLYGQCYHIQVQATPDVVQSKLSMTGTGVGFSVLDLWIYQSDFRIERMEVHTSDPDGSAAIELALSNYDGVSPIESPPPAQLPTLAPESSAT
ncbi:MAG: hypothetical protein ABSA21_10585 [Candidatus Limnocylindrales bacterium]